MKEGTKLIIMVIGLLIGMGLMVWGYLIIRNVEGYLEMMKVVRRAAAPQYISGIIIFTISYVLLKLDK